jgi:hypothetical protein
MDRRMHPAFFCGQVRASELAVRLDETRTEVELDHAKLVPLCPHPKDIEKSLNIMVLRSPKS